jgi:hypothetical protein
MKLIKVFMLCLLIFLSSIAIVNSASALESRDELSNCGLGIYDDFWEWPVAITPPVFDMESPEIINFTALVLVPYETSADVVGRLTINSTANIHPFNTTWSCTLDSRIKVKQFYSLEVKVEEHKKTVTKADNVVYRLTA